MSESDPTRSAAAQPVRVVMPHQLRALARAVGEVTVEVAPPLTVAATIAALEARYPTLVGTIRDRGGDGARRRDLIRIYGAGDDLSNLPLDTPLPPAVANGSEPLRLVGAIAGG